MYPRDRLPTMVFKHDELVYARGDNILNEVIWLPKGIWK